jgi:hypothetical protein
MFSKLFLLLYLNNGDFVSGSETFHPENKILASQRNLAPLGSFNLSPDFFSNR